MNPIYLDHASTTPLDPKVLKAMLPYLETKFGNASSIHCFGREAREAVEKARAVIAGRIGAKSNEIIFTSGGTESDNLAIKGVSYALRKKGRHIITSTIEHPAVLESFRSLERHGFSVSLIPVDRHGCIDIGKLEEAVTSETILISVMHANNEIGTIQSLKEIGEIAEHNGIYLHTDAVQSFGKLPIDVDVLKVALLSISGHKIYGPKGVGALYVRDGVEIEPILSGGGHEKNIRSGTENVPGILGLGAATDLAIKEMNENTKKMTDLRDTLIKEIKENISISRLTGHPTKRLSNNAHFCFPGIEGEALTLALDLEGIAVSTGSACSSHKKEISHVLTALGIDNLTALGSVRMTLGKDNTKTEIKRTVKAIVKSVDRLLKISPMANY